MSSNLIQMIWDSFLETIIMVAISGGIGALAAWIWGLVEGIQILTGSINKDATGRPLGD